MVPHQQLPQYLAESDIFIFASSCENMPNTLLEGMGSGLPIACSNQGPMPEILQDGGLYFNPEVPFEIAATLKKIVEEKTSREERIKCAYYLSKQYSWERCAKKTWMFLNEIHDATKD
jgi:glycosyltransferase involved in cell wall biosynthesis